jgi:hypothetical protein
VADPTGIAAGPDGALWITDPNEHLIWRVTTVGALTSVPLPSAPGGAVAEPSGIVAGSDGAMWAVDPNSSVVWRIAMSGAVTGIPVAGIQARILVPTGIAAGVNGTIWVTTGSSVSEVTSAGVVASHALPAAAGCASADPSGLVVGPDGAIWASDPNERLVWRITTSGVVTEYSLPSAVGGAVAMPGTIAVGSDGALWIVDPNEQGLGRVDPSVSGTAPPAACADAPTLPPTPTPVTVSATPLPTPTPVSVSATPLPVQLADSTPATAKSSERSASIRVLTVHIVNIHATRPELLLSFDLGEAAPLTLTITRRIARHYARVASFAFAGHSGINRLLVTRRTGLPKLANGRYQIVVHVPGERRERLFRVGG